MQLMAQGAWGAMIADGNGRWRKACHVPRNFQNTWQAESQIHKSCRSYFSFRTLCIAPVPAKALPENKKEAAAKH